MNTQAPSTATRIDTGDTGDAAPDRVSFQIEHLFATARAQLRSTVGGASPVFDELESRCKALSGRLARDYPTSGAIIGFDRPANVYLVTEIYRTGGHRRLIEQIIHSRPDERHIVLFTGALDTNRSYGHERMVAAGAFPVFPDPRLGLFDRLTWLREKLSAYAAQRVFAAHHPEDVLAAIALHEQAERLGPRLYVIRHADTVPSVGIDLPHATHLAIRPEQKQQIGAQLPQTRAFVLPLTLDRPGPFEEKGKAARPKAVDADDDSDGDDGELETNSASYAPFASGTFVTATAGTPHKFETEGPLSLPSILTRVLRTTRGTHVHFGPAPDTMREAVHRALRRVGVPKSRVTFAGEVDAVAEELVEHQVDLFLGSFPIGGAMTMLEAAAASVPIAVFAGEAGEAERYVSGRDFGPDKKLLWHTPEELTSLLGETWQDELADLSRASERWFMKSGRSSRLPRRLNAILAVVEGRGRAPITKQHRLDIVNAMVDPDFYLREYRDVAKAGVDPFKHYLNHGEKEGRHPNALFDPKLYLSQLSETERKAAAERPLCHYVLRGEARGLRPHVMFDPAVFALSRDRSGASGDIGPAGLLGAYVADGGYLRPHQFFDPDHYGRQLRMPTDGKPLLAHFLETGVGQGLSPHPLLAVKDQGDSARDRLKFLHSVLYDRTPAKDEPATSPLFDPRHFGDKTAKQYAHAAPTLLWAHLIEGNLSGHDPMTLVSVEHVEQSRPGTLAGAVTVLELLAANRLGVDAHPLVKTSYILKQAPHVSTLTVSPTEYFLENAASHNVSPHPLFSTQHYLYSNRDVREADLNPLVHFLKWGQYEGRAPSPAFNSADYYNRFLRDNGGGSPLLHYVTQGRAQFRPTMPMNPGFARLAWKMAAGLFEAGSTDAAADMLQQSIHPEQGPRHPTLRSGIHRLVTGNEAATQSTEIFPAAYQHVERPKVVSQQHIAPPAGFVDMPAATVSVYDGATVIAGNDGFLSKDGAWVDHGLAGFDRHTMQVKENAAVAAVVDDQVLLRYFAGERTFPTGIFASGSYSRNYFHFLFEVLPRVVLADKIAPKGVPILTDADMPDQHCQALRLLFPARPLIRLPRHVTCKVGKLYAGSMPNVIHDAFAEKMPAVGSTWFHPQMARTMAAMFRGLDDASGFERVFLIRKSNNRKLLNAEDLQSELVDRHEFGAIDCARLGFSDQVRKMARARDIVGQSGAHLANMLFAPEGARVFPLYSNAPGTNFYFWSQLGAALGHEVINVAGWRIEGTAKGTIPEAHEDFTLPKSLLIPFFPAQKPEDGDREDGEAAARTLLDRLYDANSDADVLTGAWSTRGDWTPAGFEERLIATRRELHAVLGTLRRAAFNDLVKHRFFTDFSRNTRSAYVTLRDFSEAETETIEAVRARFEALAAAAEMPEDGPLNARDLVLAMLYVPAWALPLPADLERVESGVRKCYLRWLITPAFLFRPGDDAGYVGYAARLLNWLADHLGPDSPDDHRFMVAELTGAIDLGQLFLVGQPVRPVLEARNRLLARVAPKDVHKARRVPRPADLSQGRIRVGLLCRTFDKGPDSEAVVSFFRAFDHSRFEIFAYSVAFADRVVSADDEFTHAFDAAIDHRRILPADPHTMRERILADDLDVFLLANATTFGVREQELALFNRVAPVQMVLNSHIPVAPGFPSFDGFITGRSDDPAAEVSGEDIPERLIRVEGPVINYLNSFKPRPEPGFDRQSLGIGADEFVMLNAGSLQKLRHECLVTMLRALAAVPNGRLVLAPYNPGWVARSQAFAFNRQLTEAAEEVGVSLDRVLVMGELSVAEAEATVALSDIYLSSFPHGGATMTHLALIYGVPPVVLRRRDTRSIDQFLVGSLGLSDLLASSTDAYIETIRSLAADPARHQALAARVREAARKPVFVANDDFSRAMQKVIVDALAAAPVEPPVVGDAGIQEATQPGKDEAMSDKTEIAGQKVTLRLVAEDDAEFIWNLRNDPAYNSHLSTTTGTADDQRAWIRRYKEREAEGTEYYFVIERTDDRSRCGVVRMYDIQDGQFTWGSWILNDNKPHKAALDSAVQIYRYGFEVLGLERSVFDVRKENTHTLRFHDRFGARRTGEDDENIYYEVPRAAFEAQADHFAALLA